MSIQKSRKAVHGRNYPDTPGTGLPTPDTTPFGEVIGVLFILILLSIVFME
jgi:hypothetical protein